MRDRHDKIEHARSFGAAAEVYERSRPDYPDDALAWVTDGVRGPVLDVGAGTGKLTAALVQRGLTVSAVDPSEKMLEILAARLPTVQASIGTAESIPTPDSSYDLVTFAQAWHWVDPDQASAEVARVLKPGGRLALLWNDRDESVGWVRELGRIMGAGETPFIDDNDPVVRPPLGALERFRTRWEQELTVEGLLELARSRSYFITKPPHVQEAVLADLRRLCAEHPELRDDPIIRLPYITRCYRASIPG